MGRNFYMHETLVRCREFPAENKITRMYDDTILLRPVYWWVAV